MGFFLGRTSRWVFLFSLGGGLGLSRGGIYLCFLALLLAVGVGEKFGRLIKRQEGGTRREKKCMDLYRALLIIVSLRSSMIA